MEALAKRKYLITSALPYANGALHFGHLAGAYLPGDCFARFQRLLGNEVLYVCGSDEYGLPITLSAQIAGRTPQEHVDLYHGINKSLFERLGFSFDHYSRTTWKGHGAVVSQFFTELKDNGFIEEKVTDQLYSEADNRFLADRYVEGECPRCHYPKARGDECPKCGASFEAVDLLHPKSKITGAPLTRRPTRHWYVRFDLFKDRLKTWLEEKSWKPNVLNFIRHYIEELRPRAITRDSDWGIPVPLQEACGKVFYVWFDAPIGYISASMEWAEKQGNPDLWKHFWQDPKTRLVQFIGKDNIPFHAVFFPAMLMGQNQPYKLVDDLPANEFYNLEGHRFSKSEGWMIDTDKFLERYTADQLRYTLAANAPETADSEFTWADFQMRCNAELVGKYGNLANRVLVFIQQRCEGKIPHRNSLEPLDEQFLQDIQRITTSISEHYEHYELRRATQAIMELAQLGNVYFDAKKPWLDAKDPICHPRMATTLSLCLEGLKALALISWPIIPSAATSLWHLLGHKDPIGTTTLSLALSQSLPVDHPLPPPHVLVHKIEDGQIQEEIAQLHALVAKATPQEPALPTSWTPMKPSITFDDFSKTDLRVATVITAEKVPKSKKLLKLSLDLGFETRTVVSGISQHYAPEDLIGKKVLLVANLAPATIMGIESHGMVLAASHGELLELPGIASLPPGSTVA